jgi:hypothetical protein
MHRFLLPLVFALGAACTGSATVAYSTPSPDPTATMVEVRPGVYAVAETDAPVFYSDNFYWRFQDGLWYRSNWYTGGWAVATPPVAVLRIDRPHRYVHYRPAAHDRVVIRDSRGRVHRR